MLAARGLGKRFGARWLFRGLEFSLAQGDCLAVLGPNGSGKSTLLRILSGLASPSEGQVDRPVGDHRLAIGVAAIEMALYPQLTPAEHLELAAELRGIPANTDDWLRRIGLEAAAGRPASQLSTGMKARVRLAMACQSQPALLILDEPTAGLDEEGAALTASLIEEQLARGCLVLATNDPRDRRFATHALTLGA